MADNKLYEVLGVDRNASDADIKKVNVKINLPTIRENI